MIVAAIGMNKFLSEEFRVFCGKWSFVALGRHGDFMVIKNVAGQNSYSLCIDWVVSFR